MRHYYYSKRLNDDDFPVIIIPISMISMILLFAFTMMKLYGLISWSWLWVLSPMWIPFLISTILGILMLIAAFVYYIVDLRSTNMKFKSLKKRYKRRNRSGL